MSEESLRSYIRDEVRKLERKIDYSKSLRQSVMAGENKAVVKYMTSWEYVWNMFQAIEEGDYGHSLHEVVFELAVGEGKGANLCTGKINLEGEKVYLKNESFLYTDQGKLGKFVEEFHKRTGGCKFSTLAINMLWKEGGKDYAHRNILFFYRSGSKITATIYEPHGSEEEHHYKNVSKFVEAFTEMYNRLYSSKMTVLERTDVSCPIGLQDHQEPGSGYCVVYSYLWFYFVCKVARRMNNDSGFVDSVFNYITGEDNITFALRNIEKNMIDVLSDKEILDITHDFAVMLVNTYIELVSAQYPSERKEFIQSLERKVEELLTRKEEDSFTYTRYNKPVRKLKRNPETGYEETMRGNDGAFCVSDEDCLSDNCVGGKCTPYDFRAKKAR